MISPRLFLKFITDDHGAISVDWVVISAACVAMGISSTNVIANGMSDMAQEIEAQLRIDMTVNPFDVDPDQLFTGCAQVYLDPAADPGATLDSCGVGAQETAESEPAAQEAQETT